MNQPKFNFARTVRDETDLENLAGELILVVNETMQPRNSNLWLKRQAQEWTRTQE